MYAQDDYDLECHGERQYNLGAELCEINENKGCGITVACQYRGGPCRYNSDASLGEQIFNIAVAQVESTVEPNGVVNDIWRESVMMRWTPLVEPAS